MRTTKDIMSVIASLHGDALRNDGFMMYSRDDFARDVYSSGLYRSMSTVREKWAMLISMGIVVSVGEAGKQRTYLRWEPFGDLLGISGESGSEYRIIGE